MSRLFHQGLVIQTSNFENTTWLGVPIRQNVLDLWTIQETIAEIRPDLVIEVGTWDGGSALFYSRLVTPGSYLLSQDGTIDERWMFADSRPRPLEANREFLQPHPEFVHDAERNDRFLLSHHPFGWMQRRKDR